MGNLEMKSFFFTLGDNVEIVVGKFAVLSNTRCACSRKMESHVLARESHKLTFLVRRQ